MAVQSLEEVAQECLKYFGKKSRKPDSARIIKPCETMYLIVGYRQNIKNNYTKWINRKGEEVNFRYEETHIVAHGKTKKELIESVKEYQRISKLDTVDYLKELVEKK